MVFAWVCGHPPFFRVLSKPMEKGQGTSSQAQIRLHFFKDKQQSKHWMRWCASSCSQNRWFLFCFVWRSSNEKFLWRFWVVLIDTQSFRSLFVFGSIGNFFVFLDRCVFLRPHSVCLLLGVGFLYLWIDHSPFALPFLQFSMEFGVISSQSGRCVKERSLGSNSSAFVFS